MPLSNSVRHRYTPPTCTLEIVAQASPLSRWIGQSLLKDLRFELCFDDPRQPTEQKVKIFGDRITLEVLHEAVTSYVQEFLNLPPTQLPLALLTATPNTEASSEVENKNEIIPLADHFVKSSQLVVEEALEASDSSLESNPKLRSLKPRSLAGSIYLQAKGLVSHQLFLGELANEESGAVVELSAIQLFDLATALDEYSASVVTLPHPNQRRSAIAPAPWSIAAAVLILAVGATTAGVQWLNPSESTQQAGAPTTQSNSNPAGKIPEIAQLPPTPTNVLPTPASPLPTPVVPPALSPPPKVVPPNPVPTPAPPTANLPQASQRPNLSINPPPQQRTVTQPLPQPAPKSTTPRLAPPPTSNTPSRSDNTQTQQSTAKAPQTLPTIPPLPSLNTTPSPSRVSAPPAQAQPGTTRSIPLPDNFNQGESRGGNQQPNGRLFDSIPQVAEVRDKLQQRWQPPAELTDKLEYDMIIKSDGSIERIIPLGQTAAVYINRTNMPLPGQPFVAPLEEGGKAKIRVVLYQDGKVETLLQR